MHVFCTNLVNIYDFQSIKSCIFSPNQRGACHWYTHYCPSPDSLLFKRQNARATKEKNPYNWLALVLSEVSANKLWHRPATLAAFFSPWRALVLLFRGRDRECLVWTHLRFLGRRACLCAHVWVRMHTCECVSKSKMWFELRPANRCLLAAGCFDRHVHLSAQWPAL